MATAVLTLRLPEEIKAKLDKLAQATHLVVSVAPDEAGDPGLRVARDAIGAKMPALEWIGYLSTVGVYGDHGGAWVDESGECRPVSRRSLLRVEAEQAWQVACAERGVPLATDFGRYHIYRADEMPQMDVVFVETYEPSGPYGAKAVAEIPKDGVAPALSSAIYDAVGVRLRELPLAPEKVWQAMQK